MDIDVYPLDHKKLAQYIRQLELPLVVCRTKSGGAHLFLFCQPAKAELVRRKLIAWAAALGYPGIEIFPKQETVTDADSGNWLNMPYFKGADTNRFAIDESGSPISLEAFLDLAEAAKLEPDKLALIEPKHVVAPRSEPVPDEDTEDTDDTDFFEGGPPCLQKLDIQGYPDGTRNNGLFNVGVFLRKSQPKNWEALLAWYNQQKMNPPLPERDVRDAIRSLKKKGYGYKCKDQPIAAVCNRSRCEKREFGIGQGNTDPGIEFGLLTKINMNPPMWMLEVLGHSIELSSEQLLDQKSVRVLVLNKTNIIMKSVKPHIWDGLVQKKLQGVQEKEAPPDADIEGQWMVHLHRFCTGQAKARQLDEILLGKPWTEDKRTFFCATDFIEFLQRQRVNGVTPKLLWSWLNRELALEHHRGKIKGKETDYWSIRAFTEQTEAFGVPRSQQRSEF